MWNSQVIIMLLEGIRDTLYMTLASTLFGYIIGLPMGIVLTVTDKGQGKRTDISEYRVQSRGGKGIINLKVTNKTGLIVGSKFINESQEIMLISAAGIIIRMNAADISTYGRNAQGVKLMDLDEGDKVAALAVVNTVSEEE